MKAHQDQHYGAVTYSQHGEDIMIVNIFTLLGIEKPRYLDVGCNHPVNISNTYLLYLRGSRGTVVDANGNMRELFQKHRPDDVFVHSAVGAEPNATLTNLYMFTPTCGRNTTSKEEADRYSKEHGPKVKSVVEVACVPLNMVLTTMAKQGRTPDFLSVDIEGMDYMVLQATNLEKGPKVVCVEVRRKDTAEFDTMMNTKGFIHYCRMGENVIYIRDELVGELLDL